MRQRDEQRSAERGAAPRASDDVAERRLTPEPVDRERSDKEDDLGSDERELGFEPRCAQRDLGR